MPDQPQPALHTLLLHLLPADHTTVGNITLLEQFLAAAQAACFAAHAVFARL